MGPSVSYILRIFFAFGHFGKKYQLQQCSEDVEVTTNFIIDEYSLSTYLLIKRDVDIAISKFIVYIKQRIDAKFKKFRQAPWIHSTGNPLQSNNEWWNSKMEKKHRAPFMSASFNPQQEHVISSCVPVGNASFSNDLPNIYNLCKFQETTSTYNVHDTLLLPLSGDTNITNIEKSNNSDVVDNWIDLINSIPTSNVLISSCNIAVSRKTQSLTSCHETLISHNTYSNSVIANTTSANINTSSDNMLTSVAPTKLADDVYETSSEEEVFNQTHTPTSLDKSHAVCETSSANLSSGFLHKFMECVQLRRDDFASVINLRDYLLTVPHLRVLSRGLKFTPLPHSVDRSSLREALLNLNVDCDLQNFFTRQIILTMITDITSSVLNLPGLPFPTVTNF